ncbi:MAG: hypothetical protein KKH32_08100 [Bacteroidetes bacterium]|nr:hypothetical protein [Bacteroidota bacterium]
MIIYISTVEFLGRRAGQVRRAGCNSLLQQQARNNQSLSGLKNRFELYGSRPPASPARLIVSHEVGGLVLVRRAG